MAATLEGQLQGAPGAVAGQELALRLAGVKLQPVWKQLDRLYLAGGYLAAICMLCIFALTMAQITGRLVGYNLRGATDYAGYFMAASAFLAFAHTLNRGVHVRIELFLSMLGTYRRWAEKICFLCSAAIALWFAYYFWKLVYWSYLLGDVSQGLDATPIWIPQTTMAIGASLLAVAIADHGLRLLLTGDHGIETAPEAV
jgi:TRAP-type C4-dicarboxylate transport system permease small subunit